MSEQAPHTASHESLVGVVVDGRYTIERPLASGGMGSVYLARQRNLARPVAIKVVSGDDPELLERFRREAESLGQVSHPAIVEVHDFVQESGPAGRGFLVMSYVEGQDLADYLDELPAGRVPPAEAVNLVLPVASALVQLHANGIVHRDIKPANLIRFEGADGRPAVKLVDFGIARRAVDTSLTSAGFIVGTPPYMAPETLMAKPHTPVADVYALGATLFELLTGAPPYGTGRLHEIMARALSDPVRLPPELQGTRLGDLLLAVLDRDEARRPDALQVVQALERIRDELAAQRIHSARDLPTLQTSTREASGNGSAAGAGAMSVTRPVRPGDRPGGAPPAGRPLATAPTALAAPAGAVPTAAAPVSAAPAVRPGAPAARPSRRGRWRWGALVAGLLGLGGLVWWATTLPSSGSRTSSRRSGETDLGADAAVRGAGRAASAPRRPAARAHASVRPRRASHRSPSAWATELARRCTGRKVAKRYFAEGRAAAKRKQYDRALAHYLAVLRCAYATHEERRWAAYLASNNYRMRGVCGPARRLWQAHRKLSLAAGKRPNRWEGCSGGRGR